MNVVDNSEWNDALSVVTESFLHLDAVLIPLKTDPFNWGT